MFITLTILLIWAIGAAIVLGLARSAADGDRGGHEAAPAGRPLPVASP